MKEGFARGSLNLFSLRTLSSCFNYSLLSSLGYTGLNTDEKIKWLQCQFKPIRLASYSWKKPIQSSKKVLKMKINWHFNDNGNLRHEETTEIRFYFFFYIHTRVHLSLCFSRPSRLQYEPTILYTYIGICHA